MRWRYLPNVKLVECFRKGEDPNNILGQVCDITSGELINEDKEKEQHAVIIPPYLGVEIKKYFYTES